ncbi:MAG: TraR/DksA C4-type zinc finger protein [Pseudomonadota bacterium]|nr:TraR/DksA C4-type zinc finger protein [Pseudomonadota bacterium]
MELQMERFADVIDMAQAHIEMETERRIADIRHEARTGTGSSSCIDCGNEIPANRRKHLPGAVRCVPCQHLRESTR